MSLDIASDGNILVSGSADKNLKVWGLDFGDCRKSIFAHQVCGVCVCVCYVFVVRFFVRLFVCVLGLDFGDCRKSIFAHRVCVFVCAFVFVCLCLCMCVCVCSCVIAVSFSSSSFYTPGVFLCFIGICAPCANSFPHILQSESLFFFYFAKWKFVLFYFPKWKFVLFYFTLISAYDRTRLCKYSSYPIRIICSRYRKIKPLNTGTWTR